MTQHKFFSFEIYPWRPTAKGSLEGSSWPWVSHAARVSHRPSGSPGPVERHVVRRHPAAGRTAVSEGCAEPGSASVSAAWSEPSERAGRRLSVGPSAEGGRCVPKGHRPPK